MIVLAATCVAGLAIGARQIPFATVLDAIFHAQPGNHDHSVVMDQRLPRVVLGALAGMGFAVAGALMQGMSRNPIADPGLLGINTGASLMVVVAIAGFGVSSFGNLRWFAFAGAAVAMLLVYGAAAVGPEGASPVRLALLGAAFAASMSAIATIILLTRQDALDGYRFWTVGSLVGRDLGDAAAIAPFIVVGLVLAVAATRFLNAVSMGEDVARGLGESFIGGHAMVVAATVLLAGGATALAGPIIFVGLIVPHLARLWVGPDYRWITLYSIVLGPIVLILADVVGRVVVPGELEAGIVLSIVGAPVLVLLVRRSREVAM